MAVAKSAESAGSVRHPESHDWPWHPDLRDVFDSLGLVWRVLPPGESLSPQDLKSSPGDCVYTGSVFVFEFLCPPEWVVHELAHWLVCRADRPIYLNLRNYGHDIALSLGGAAKDEWRVCLLTCGLEKLLDLGDYRETAGLLLPDGEGLDERIEEVVAPFLEELRLPVDTR